ncbi:ribosome maturation factor RimM [Ideonella sp. BN130291]|uniref:ribosome maturation factor RimM n=1 Tax=Ideonella sp. BN130291 TaxID=3112940 RepID=UPI002E26BF55|nr:ribosome maturation factor RimM [Ideonella sp. BN130291]MED5618621.1 ribosome maturation factor RimM [Ideonella sp. BN130291]
MAAAGWPEDAVEVGRIADAWGVKGWIKVQPFSNEPQALLAARHWLLKPADGPGAVRPVTAAKPLPHELKITAARRHGDAVVASAEGVQDRSAAESLRGARVFVSRATFPPAETDEYYWVDLIGLAVVNRQGEPLGTVADLIDTGPHTVLRAVKEGDPPSEHLIPFVAAYVDDVNMAQRRITVDWGLDY